jgi:hypothetical protein
MTSILKPYWVWKWCDSPCECGCCCSPTVIKENGGYTFCIQTDKRWFVVPAEPDLTKPHVQEVCMGNCPFHPLLTKDMHILSNAHLYQTTWGDYLADLEEAMLAAETEEQKAERIQKEFQSAQEARARQDAILREVYARKMADNSTRGVNTKKGEAPKKLERPCKWMCGAEAEASARRKENPCCWAWEYMDPKTKKFMTPHTCMYQHPGEPGWHDEWLSDPMWKAENNNNNNNNNNNRFASLRGRSIRRF